MNWRKQIQEHLRDADEQAVLVVTALSSDSHVERERARAYVPDIDAAFARIEKRVDNARELWAAVRAGHSLPTCGYSDAHLDTALRKLVAVRGAPMTELTDATRQKLVDNARFLVAHKALIYYRQERPFPIIRRATLEADFKAGTSLSCWDCSASIIELYHLAGARDPSGYEFKGFGNTETFLEHLPRYSDPSHAHPGAIVVFNANLHLSVQHAVMVVEQGHDPVCFTHGGNADPNEYRLSQLQPGFHGKTVFLDVSHLGA